MSSAETRSARTARAPQRRPPSGGEARAAPARAAASLLGRSEELAALGQLVGRERLVTLTGTPGIGKSRLALALAEQLGARLAGGAHVAELAPLALARDVPRAVAAALSVDEISGQELTDTIIARLSRRHRLLVLDNCEHLIVACGELVEALQAGCPELRVVATSREPLALSGERVWQVPPLAVPPAAETSLAALADYPAVALFLERAAAVREGFSLNAYLRPAVVEICRRLDGIPLAIELAAARVGSLTPHEIADRLNDRFDLLTKGASGHVARHQTLEAALDWSHALLSEAERILLRRLSVFAGGFDTDAAAAACAGGELASRPIPKLLQGLAAKSLLDADAHAKRQGRYRLLETIRAYAGERLEEAGETAALREAHARFYLALAEEAEPQLTGPRQQEWLARLEQERQNVRSALEWSLSHGREEWALRLAGALVLFWRVRCHFSEGRELLDAAVSINDGRPPAGVWAKALWGAGFMAIMVGDIDDAAGLVEESLTCFRELNDPQGCARALMILGNCAQFRDRSEALLLLEQSAIEARAAGDSWCLGHALAIAGEEYCSRCELDRARALLEECLGVARAAGDRQGIHWGLAGLGFVAHHQGEFDSAESLLEEAVVVTAELGEDYSRATALQWLGAVANARGDYVRAVELLDDALALMRESGPALALPALLALRGEVAYAVGEVDRARLLLEDALALGRAGSGTPVPALQMMGQLAAAEGDLHVARRHLEEGLEVAHARHDKAGTARTLHALGGLTRVEGAIKRAAALHRDSLELCHEIGGAPWIAASLEALAGVAAQEGQFQRAARLLGSASALRDEKGYARPPWEVSRYEADLALVHRQLHPKEFAGALAEGGSLSIAAAVAEALKAPPNANPATSAWSSLTAREQEVADLAAGGLTNPEIAERLCISRETVKTHLWHVFSKLGVSRRRELEREVRRQRDQPLDD